MLNPIVSSVVYAFDMLIVYIFFSRITEKAISTLKCFLLGLFLFEIGSVFNLLFQNNLLINTILSISIRILFALICFNIRPFRAISYSVILVAINFALELISVLVLSSLTNTALDDYNSSISLLIVECSICKIFFFFTCLVLSSVVVPNAKFSRHQFLLLVFPVSSGICLGIFWYIGNQNNISPEIQYWLAIASIIIFSSTVLLFITYQHQIEMESNQIRIESENERLQTEKSYYDILEQQNHKLMIFAHDSKNHLAAIHSLNENEAIEKYITALQAQLSTYTKNCHSGNMMLDVIIDKYLIDCERRDIKFDYCVRTCNLKRVEDIDLVAILGNLLDNAVTAAEASKDRLVTFETTVRNDYSVIVIANSCDLLPNTHAGVLVTSKADNKLHGYGLKSVSQTLKKYNGDYSWEYFAADRMFVVTVMIGEATKR